MSSSTLRVFRRVSAPWTRRIRERLASYLDARDDAYVWELATLQRNSDEILLPIPPPEIRYRVVNRPESKLQHLRTGLAIEASITAAVEDLGMSIRGFESVLDWGCGCSRVLRHLHHLNSEVRLTGYDIDQVTIEWSRRNIDGIAFAVNGELPPLPSDNESFDLIYGASVFSHLDEKHQQAWLKELHRVLQPGGVLLLSTHGDRAMDFSADQVPQLNKDEYLRSGFTFIENLQDGILPQWYQTSFQNEQHVRETFSPIINVSAFHPAGMAGFQDLVVCVKE